MLSFQRLFCSAFFFIGLTDFSQAGEKIDVKAALEKRIIDAQLPLKEIEDYTESHVPPMPEVASVEEWEKHAKRMRQETLDRVVFRGEAARWRDAKTKVEFLETIPGGPGYHIRHLRYEALPGLWIPALLYEPTKLEGKVPVVLNVNGHGRTTGKGGKNKQIRCINQAKRGMLALNVEWLGMSQLNTPGFVHYKMNQIDLCGTSGLAPFYLSMSRGLDILLEHKNADPKRVAVTGLSGGGWQTIIISALDTRVTLSDPVAGYSSFKTRSRFHSDLGDSEQTPVDLATTADYAQLTAMRAPHPTLLTFNANDNCCFKADHALPPLLEAARPIFRLYGKGDNLRHHVNEVPGNHNFGLDNRQALYRMFGEFFYPDDEKFDPTEIPSEDEVKTQEQIKVPLPENNADFHTLAMELSKNLPKNSDIPTEAAAKSWRIEKRKDLSELVRAKEYEVKVVESSKEEFGDASAVYWKLKIGDHWTVPVTELAPADAKSTVILLADDGRKSAVAQSNKLLAAGHRVLAVDPFYLGESKITSRDYLFGLLVSAIGDRPLGLQSSQLAALARSAEKYYKNGPVKIVAVGPRTSLMAIVAAGLEESSISGLELQGSFSSLKEIIENDMTVQQAPELFCFGLLEQFDMPQLIALVKPRPVELVKSAE